MPKPITVDIAAGGLVESVGNDGELEIALIYRPRHTDWSLPKGHLDKGESLEEAAVREVLEETGCEAEIIEIVPPLSYLVNGRPKIVVYYRMKLIGARVFRANDETTDMIWLSPASAAEKLDYEGDRSLVRTVYGV